MIRKYLPRSLRYWWQRRTRGWDDSELWSLDCTIARFALPRLRRFAEIRHGEPSDEVLGELIWFLEQHVHPDWPWQEEITTDSEGALRFERAQRLWGEHFSSLWD